MIREFGILDIAKLREPAYRKFVDPEGNIVRFSIKQRILIDAALKLANSPNSIRVFQLANKFEARTRAIRKLGVAIDGGDKQGFTQNAFDDQIRQLEIKGLTGFIEVIGFTNGSFVKIHPEALERFHRPDARKQLKSWAKKTYFSPSE